MLKRKLWKRREESKSLKNWRKQHVFIHRTCSILLCLVHLKGWRRLSSGRHPHHTPHKDMECDEDNTSVLPAILLQDDFHDEVVPLSNEIPNVNLKISISDNSEERLNAVKTFTEKYSKQKAIKKWIFIACICIVINLTVYKKMIPLLMHRKSPISEM